MFYVLFMFYIYVYTFLHQVLYEFVPDSHSVSKTVTENMMSVLCP